MKSPILPLASSIILGMAFLGSHAAHCTMRFGSTAKVLLMCKLKYYGISKCLDPCPSGPQRLLPSLGPHQPVHVFDSSSRGQRADWPPTARAGEKCTSLLLLQLVCPQISRGVDLQGWQRAHLFAEGADEGDLPVLCQEVGDHRLNGLYEVAVLILLLAILLGSQPSIDLAVKASFSHAPASLSSQVSGPA